MTSYHDFIILLLCLYRLKKLQTQLPLKFLPGKILLEKGTLEFKSPEEATTNSLASKLFTDVNVKGVFIGKDFLTVTKSEAVEWEILKPTLLSSILDYFSSGGDN